MIGTVLALGGGGFSTLDEASDIDDHLLDLTGKNDPKVCFVPTASGDAEPYIERSVTAFTGRAPTSVLSLFCHDPLGYSDPQLLLEQDVCTWVAGPRRPPRSGGCTVSRTSRAAASRRLRRASTNQATVVMTVPTSDKKTNESMNRGRSDK
jgi:Peptidase family S51